MDKQSILVFDSGIGGISVFKRLKDTFPFADLYYASNISNAPFGRKTKSELNVIAYNNILKFYKFGFRIIIIACNTITTNCLSFLKISFPDITFIGVKPPVEIARNDKTVLFCTTATKFSYYVKKAVAEYPLLKVVALPGLVCDIENNLKDLNQIDLKKHLCGFNYDASCIILGCTHFCHLRQKFKNFYPKSKIFDGFDNVIINIEKSVTTLATFNPVTQNNFIFEDKIRNYEFYKYLENDLFI